MTTADRPKERPDTNTISWWVGLTRDELRAAVAARAAVFAAQRQPFLDTIGARLASDEWHASRSRRDED